MLKNAGTKITILVIVLGSFFYWYYFLDTLKLTQLTGKPDNPLASLFVSLVDFDTGLTRYDISILSRRSDYWQRRMQEVMAIQNYEQRNIENERLLAEMLEDPSIKKIAKKLMGFGTDAMMAILKASR